MMDIIELKKNIAPFFWVEHEDHVSVCLNMGIYKTHIFETRMEEGFDGNGYDWASLAKVFLHEKKYNLRKKIKFDPEGSMFCVYSYDSEALQEFILSFIKDCEDDALIQDLFSRAELD